LFREFIMINFDMYTKYRNNSRSKSKEYWSMIAIAF